MGGPRAATWTLICWHGTLAALLAAATSENGSDAGNSSEPNSGRRSAPEHWLLSSEEIRTARGSHERNKADGHFPSINDWTSGNVVDFIIDGSTYLGKIKEELDACDQGDTVYVNGWTFSPKIEMSPKANQTLGKWYDCQDDTALTAACTTGFLCNVDAGIVSGDFPVGKDKDHVCCKNPKDSRCTSSEGIMARATDRGVNILIMSWQNPFPGTQGGTYLGLGQEQMNAIFLKDEKVKSVFALDGRTVGASGSVHQKAFTFVRKGEPLVSYVGGFDVAKCRYDRTDAKPGDSGDTVAAAARRLSVIEGCYGWLDQALRIEGPGAADIANTFVQRWNWEKDFSAWQYTADEDAAFHARTGRKLDATMPGAAPEEGSTSQYVQILRTYSCQYDAPFAPKGEITIFDGLLKAIKASERYVFLEDQYGFYVMEVRAALLDAVKRGVVLVVVVNFFGAGANFYCSGNGFHAWEQIKQAGGHIFQYNKAEYKDYIHAKTWIVDDCWLLTGSANLNQRSMTLDPELSTSIMDATCDTFEGDVHVENWVKKSRCTMWAELASVENHTVADICKAKDRTPENLKELVKGIFGTTDSPMARKLQGLETYTQDTLKDSAKIVYSTLACASTDPDGRCNASWTRNLPLGYWETFLAALVVVVGTALVGMCIGLLICGCCSKASNIGPGAE